MKTPRTPKRSTGSTMTSAVAGTLSDDPVVEIEDELRLGGQVGQPVAGGGSKDPAEVNDVAQPVEGDLKFAGAPPERRPVVVMSMVRSSIVEQASMASAWRASFLNRTSLVSACAAKDVWRGYLRSAEPMGEGGALADTGGDQMLGPLPAAPCRLPRAWDRFEGGRIQPVSARSSASFSDGFINPRVLRGRLLRLRAKRARSSALWTDRSVPLGMYWRSSPLVFSLEPRCQGLWGSQK